MGRRKKNLAILLSAVSTMTAVGCGGAVGEDWGAARGELEEPGGVVTGAWGGSEWELCDPTPRLVKDIHGGSPDADPRGMIHGDGVLVFSADDDATGREPWASTGETRRTKLLGDLYPGRVGSEPDQFTRLGDTVFFVANDGSHGRELWKTDGTASGTVRVEDIHPGAEGSEPMHLVVFDGVLYFSADDGVHGRELWRSDGTAAGTYLLHDFTPLPGYRTYIQSMAATKGYLYVDLGIDRPDPDDGTIELWRTDGTPGGALQLDSAAYYNSISDLTPVGDQLFFLYNFDDEEEELYVVDDGATTVRYVRQFPRIPHDLTAFRDKLYFASGETLDRGEGYLGDELWRSDGTTEGTELVKDIRPGEEGSEPRGLTVVGDTLYFSADDGVHGRELWKSDGTTSGTMLLRDLVPGAPGSSPEELTSIEGYLFFSAWTSGGGREAWVSDGSGAGTWALGEVAPGTVSSTPRGFVRSGWDVFFSADDGGRAGRELRAVRFRPEGRCDPHLAPSGG